MYFERVSMKISNTYVSSFIAAGIVIVSSINIFAGGISFGQIQAVNKKVDEYNEKFKQQGIDNGTWRDTKNGGTIGGSVKNSLGSTISSGYFWLILDNNYSYYMNSSMGGNYVFADLAPGTHKIKVMGNIGSSYGVVIDEKTAVVSSKQTTTMDFHIAAITGKVTGAAGNPLSGVSISLDGNQTINNNYIYTDTSGSYIILYSSPGVHLITAKNGARIANANIIVTAEQTATKNIAFDWVALASTLSGDYSGDSRLTTANSPYTVTGNVTTANLLVDPGVVIKFAGANSFSVSGSSVIMNGTASSPIKFTSGRLVPAAGDYTYVNIGTSNYGQQSTTQINYVTFEYGSNQGIFGDSASTLMNCTFKNTNSNSVDLYTEGIVSHCGFENNSGADLYITGSPKISYCKISGQLYVPNTGKQYQLNHCNLTKGSGTILNNNANWMIDATNNWWGTTTPATIAGYISASVGTISYTPFLGVAEATAGPQ